ncbi:MOSC domain-containing protein [Leekyejoonella antrihumi]|uniref:MOSC domain-containing protein n=1 Tax=Leekyejoonella antrihumi TaxID=1660198 RepID=A0A563E6F2_9MICO|nr:MOSC domain-containing protein [Leekyejoonella antrihumi]TWP37414.1 MOSC domain-containing protein [Leekyejoonella antrihumi]
MQITALNVHPVKSTAIRPLQSAYAARPGLCGDREWMVVTADHVLLTARECPALFSIVADTPTTDTAVLRSLRLQAAGVEALELDTPDAEPVAVRLHRHDLLARPAGERADSWVQQVIGRDDVHLVWCHDPQARRLNPAHSRPDDYTAFADGYPITLASTTSLAQLNRWIAQEAADRGEPAPKPLPMQRFRPNLVVDGIAEAFEEDGWHRIRVGQVELRVAKSIDRCVMTTIDIAALTKGKEPIRTLARHRRWDGKTWFARHLIPDTEGIIRVGDPVTVLD